MNKKILILTIPGIGTKQTGYSKGFQEDVLKHTRKHEVSRNIIFQETVPFNHTQVDDNQQALFDRLKKDNKLGGMFSMRKLVLEAFGDGVTFEHKPYEENSSYKKVHRYLRLEFQKAIDTYSTFDKVALIIVAGSMGGHLLSTYLWDADKGIGIFENNQASPDEKLESLKYLATIGCNIPLFVSGFAENDIVPFKKRNNTFIWDNFYDKDDVLGWPLEPLNNKYKELVHDHEINTGVYVGSHLRYWTDNDFTRPFSEKLISLFDNL